MRELRIIDIDSYIYSLVFKRLRDLAYFFCVQWVMIHFSLKCVGKKEKIL